MMAESSEISTPTVGSSEGLAEDPQISLEPEDGGVSEVDSYYAQGEENPSDEQGAEQISNANDVDDPLCQSNEDGVQDQINLLESDDQIDYAYDTNDVEFENQEDEFETEDQTNALETGDEADKFDVEDQENEFDLEDQVNELDEANTQDEMDEEKDEAGVEEVEMTDDKIENEKSKAEEKYEAEKAAERLANKESAAEMAERERRKKEREEDKLARKVDLNIMPQVNVANLGKRKYQVKLYPLKPSDCQTGALGGVFRLANESLLYMYTVGRMANGKAELYMSTFNKVFGVMQKLLKFDFHSPETNVKIIRKDDDNKVIERAFIRFDNKVMKRFWLLSGLIHSPRIRKGGKRERIIGSVFVQNLPESATKDMLRLMFPFAAEINYNPEKFKDGTARIVLGSRLAVDPCVKAFTRLELNGNILEIRPLEKRKKEDEEKDEKETKSVEKEASASDGDKAKAEGEAESEKTDKSTPSKSSETDKTTPSKSEKADKSSPSKTEPKAAPQASGKKNVTYPKRKARDRTMELAARRRQQARDFFNRSSKKAARRPGGFGRTEVRAPDTSRLSRSPGRAEHLNRFNKTFVPQVPAAATDNMIHLQVQLNAAIKNQLAMLNQTQLAVEKAKREAVMSAVSRTAEFATPNPPMWQPAPEQRRQAAATSPRNRQQGKNNRRRRSRSDSGSFGGQGAKRSATDAGFSDFQDDDLFFRDEKRDSNSDRKWGQSPSTDMYAKQRERQMIQQRQLIQQRKEQEERERQRQQQLMGQHRMGATQQNKSQARGGRGKKQQQQQRNRNKGQHFGLQQGQRMQHRAQQQQSFAQDYDVDNFSYGSSQGQSESFGSRGASSRAFRGGQTSGGFGSGLGRNSSFGGSSSRAFGGNASGGSSFQGSSLYSYDGGYDRQDY